MEKREDEEITNGHEFYLRHLVLLLRAAPLALKGFICKKVKHGNGNLAALIFEKQDAFKKSYREESLPLFEADKVNDNMDSWNVHLLCVVILVLFHAESTSQGADFKAVECILEQTKDLDKYVEAAFLDFNTFKSKWVPLHGAIIELFEDTDKRYQLECKQMMFSCQPGSIRISSELIKSLKEERDVRKHVEFALQNKAELDQRNQNSNNQHEPKKLENANIMFIEKLKDTIVYADNPTNLICNLNVSGENVKWRHNSKPIEDSETMKIVKKGSFHWLAIFSAKLEDAGPYSCTCGNTVTAAYLTVSENPLTVTKELHVATEESNVSENMDIVLVCKVSLHTSYVTWQHKGEEIKSKRHHISFDGNAHKLTIFNAQYEDEGEYTVDFGTTKSRTIVTLKGKLSHRAQLKNDLFKNWIRGALGLKYLKFGLEVVSRSIVEKHHTYLLTRLSIANICTQCTTEELLPAHQQQNCPNPSKCICSKQRYKRKQCPNGGFCSNFYDKVMFDHRFFQPSLANTDIQQWAIDPWSVAKCYISTSGYHDKLSEKEIDCAGLLNLFINNTFFERSLNQIEINGETDVFKKAKDIRNDILHNANYELSTGQLNHYLDIFISVLEVKDVNENHPLSSYRGTEEAFNNLNELRNNEIDISIRGDFQKQIQELKEHAMPDIAEKVEAATKQNEVKQQHLEERLAEKEKELQLRHDLRSSQYEENDKTDSQAIFELDLHLQVFEQTGETGTLENLRIYQSMMNYYRVLKKKSDQNTLPTDGSVQRLLELLKVLENCTIADISNAKTSVVIKISCSTCKAIATLLSLIDGHEFQKELMELRKCLEKEMSLKISEVIVTCSSESLENTRKQLPKQAKMKDLTCEESLDRTQTSSDHDKDVAHGQKQSLVLEHEIGEYDVREKNHYIFKKENDDSVCNITSIRILPNSEILLVDPQNCRLKKLDQSYSSVSHCDIPHTPFDVCFIGNDRAVVSMETYGIQFVNVSGKMKLKQQVNLDHECYSLAFTGEKLYVFDANHVYRYNKDCQQKLVICRIPVYGKPSDKWIRHIAVSDDGKRIYIINDIEGLIIIDNRGNHLFTLTDRVAGFASDVCVVGDGTVLVSASENVYQISCRGDKVHGTVYTCESGSHPLQSLCFDRKHCRLLFIRARENHISVIQFKHCPTL